MKFSEMSPTIDLTRELWFPVLAPDADGDGFQENLRLSSNAFFELFGGSGGGPTVRFFSVNVLIEEEGVEEYNNYNNDGAQGGDSIAIGKNTLVNGVESIILGNGNYVETPSNIGVGHYLEIAGENLVQIGHGTVCEGDVGVVVGTRSKAARNSVVVGTSTSTYGENHISLGHNNRINGNNSIVIAHNAEVSENSSENIIIDPVVGDLPFYEVAPSASIIMGTGQTYNHNTDDGVGKVIIGRNNKLDGTDNVVIGSDNNNTFPPTELSNGYGSITIGNSNTQFGLYNSLLGYGNQVIKSNNESHSRSHTVGTNNVITGFQCNAIGNENKFSQMGDYQNTSLNGHHNNISGISLDVTVNGNRNTISQNGTQDLAVLGHGNNVNGTLRQTVIGSGNTVESSALESLVIGYGIHAKYSNVTYLGNGTSIEFVESTRDYRFYDPVNKHQYSYLTGDITYKTLPSLENRAWYTGVELLALKANTVITNVAAGADDNHAVNVKQLKTAIDIDNNDFALFGKANEYAVYNFSPAILSYFVQWHVTWFEEGIDKTIILETDTDKRAWISDNFTIIKNIYDMNGDEVGWALRYEGGYNLELRYTAQSHDGQTNLEILPVKEVLNGGYDALNNVSTLGLRSPIHPYNLNTGPWEYNHSLHPTKANVFYLISYLPPPMM